VCFFKVCTQLWTAFFIFRSGLSDIRINCNQIREGLLHHSEDGYIKVLN
jgi:hypothetical protein